MTAITGNRNIENAAIVIEQQRLAGRTARDTRGTGAAGDLLSGERVIEVKANGRIGTRPAGDAGCLRAVP